MQRAILFHGPGRPFEAARFPTPEPRGAEVLVRVACCTLCRSDLHTHAGRRTEPTPSVLGHEVVGRVEAFGPDAVRTDLRGDPLHVGDRVIWAVIAACGTCQACADGLPQKCGLGYKYGHRKATPDQPFVGGLADLVLLVAGTAILRVPEALPDALAAQAGCATATVAAVLRTGGPVAGRTVLILGAGVLGLTAAAMGRAAGARAVIVSEPDADRRTRAVAFGATHALPSDQLSDALADITGGRGADLAYELAGSADPVQAALAGVRTGGTLVLAGTVAPTPAIPLDPEAVVRRMLTIRGVHNYTPDDLITAVAFLKEHVASLPFVDLSGPTFRLDDVEQAFVHAHAHPGTRVAVVP